MQSHVCLVSKSRSIKASPRKVSFAPSCFQLRGTWIAKVGKRTAFQVLFHVLAVICLHIVQNGRGVPVASTVQPVLLVEI